ncbi:MAG: peptide ABC transporter permease [Hyphomicrobiales bacterium]|nr:MAG: peptide ABC transporter permease [Hyphomicrobiales bacterium]
MSARPPIIWMLVTLLFGLLAAFGPLIAPFEPTNGDLSAQFVAPLGRDEAGLLHVLGTDQFGRDVLSRVIHGARISIIVSVVSIAIAGTIGVVLGMLAGFHGGWIDAVIMRIADITLSIPAFLVALVLAVVVGASAQNVVLVVALLLWPRYARQVRGETLSIARKEFVDYALVAGTPTSATLLRHVLPNLAPTLIVLSTWQAGYVILLESSLSFLGAGVPPPDPAWGLMIAEGMRNLNAAWWISTFPGLCIVALVMATNLLGDWLRDRLDPMLAVA